MKVAVLNPTTSQLVEKMAALFPEGVDLVGPRADAKGNWNNCDKRLDEWAEVGLKVNIVERPFDELDFGIYDLLIESAETFLYTKSWYDHCQQVKCPVLLKVCWMSNVNYLPPEYVVARKKFPVLLEMPSHEQNWKAAGFKDVNVIPNPVGDWWFERPWTGAVERALIVLAGRDIWRGSDPLSLGFDRWREIERRFPGRTYHQDAVKVFRTSRQMTELFSESRVFVNLDGVNERPLALVFTEAVSAGLPVAARNLPDLNYNKYIDTNGVCSDNLEEVCTFIEKCLTNLPYAQQCSERSRELGRAAFSTENLRPRYAKIIERAKGAFSS